MSNKPNWRVHLGDGENVFVNSAADAVLLGKKLAALAAENERLRKAGDALQKGWIKDIRQTAAGRMTIKTIEDCFPAIADWNAAKEGAVK